MVIQNLYPISKPPTVTYALGPNMTIDPHRRVGLRSCEEMSYWDSVLITGEPDDATLRQWVLFHAFVLSDALPLRHYEAGGVAYQIEEQDAACSGSCDYDDLLDTMYLSLEGSRRAPKTSYRSLFDTFRTIDEPTLHLVKTSLLDFSPGRHRAGMLLLNKAYWSIAASHSVIESVIGEQPSTCEADCPICGKKLPKHRRMPERQWTEERLNDMMGEGVITEEYAAVIHCIRLQVRHPVVHQGSHPNAASPCLEMGTTRYSASRAVEEFGNDAVALDALQRSAGEIARRLLLEKVFGLGVFPRLPIRSVHVASMSFAVADQENE